MGSDYKGNIPKGYFVLKTKTYRHWMLLRAVAEPEENDQAIARFKKTFKIYPLSQVNKPEVNEFVNLSNKKYNTIHANDASFYDELNEVIQYEPANSGDPEFLGLAAAIGIKKGQPFNPDARMKNILKEAAALGNAKGLKMNKDGSVTVYFGPTAPKDKQGNWVQTMPNKGFHVLLRLYGPLQAWFDKSWKPGDFELVK